MSRKHAKVRNKTNSEQFGSKNQFYKIYGKKNVEVT